MKQLYYRVYYTIYRGLLWLGQSHETDMVRFNVVFIQSLFTVFVALGLLSMLIGLLGRSFIVHSTIQSIIFALFILGANCYVIFRKNRYNEIEASQFSDWEKSKVKNILLTISLMLFSIIFMIMSFLFLKANPLKK